MTNIKGFRVGSDLYNQNIKNVVTKEAQGFLLASFLGGVVGGVVGGILAVGLGAVFF